MKYLIITLTFTTLTFSFCSGQSLKKYPIGNSGCSFYTFCDPGIFDASYSNDSSLVYTGVCASADSLTYGVICVKLKQPINSGKETEDLMIAYLGFLKSAFEIVSSTGYGKGHSMDKKPEATGIVDYWQDKAGGNLKVKCWSDGKYIAVMYAYANGKMNETPKVNVFLDSFRFPGM
jgi:hypothetical protein